MSSCSSFALARLSGTLVIAEFVSLSLDVFVTTYNFTSSMFIQEPIQSKDSTI
jgi:hypothetical protein